MPSRHRRVRLRSLAAAALLAAPLPAPAHARPVSGEQVLFAASHQPGYACFRIPALVRTDAGTLLAFAEGRVHDCGDAGDIDIVVRRSTDGGHTWGPLTVVDDGGGDTHGNPAPVVDHATGRVLLAETYNPGRTDARACAAPCVRTPHLRHSDDDGRTWSAARPLAAEIRPPHWNAWYATGPGHGLQVTRGPHAGRLVVGVNAETRSGGRITAHHAALAVSDDHGAHWRIGATDTWPVAADGTFRQKPSELTVAERADGSLLVSGREQDGTDLGHRTQTVSHDGGDSFASPFRALPDLYAPQVQGSVVRLGGRLLLSSPGDPDRRRTLLLRSSYDGGRTWESTDRATPVTRDRAGYSDLARIAPATVGLLHEAGTADSREEIRFARFTAADLARRRGPDPVTPDLAPHRRPATVLGHPRATAGVHGGALEFDGVDDAVRLPYDRRLPLGTAGFTVALSFRYRTGPGERPLLSMGGVGPAQPQVRLTGEPGTGRVRGVMTVRAGATTVRTATVVTAGGYDDGRWHRAVLRRGGGRLTLSVDGRSVTTADVPGSVSRNSPFGVHLGQRMDGRAFLTGALDEVRVWNRTLTDAEVAAAAASGSAQDTVLWLPLDRVRG